jgi:aryl-alcohol dehydrogenase-like predicted oxidoreductase
MNTRQLGTTDLHITPLGFGAWAIGGEWRFGWGPQDDLVSVRAVVRAVEQGMNWIDTAPAYGLGHSEEIVGRALRQVPATSRPYVFTKSTLVWDEARTVRHDLTADSIRAEVEGSLTRLGVEVIDLYQMHWPRWPPQDGSPGSLHEAWSTMAALQQEGKVRYIGVSNFTVADLDEARAIAPVASLQPPYSMLRRDAERELLPYCQQHGIGVLVYSPMLSGMLTGAMTRQRLASLPATDWRRNHKEFQEPRLSKNLELVDVLRAIALGHERSPGEVAIAWVLRHPAVTGAIVGGRSAEQVDGVVGAVTLELNESEIADIEEALAENAA